MPSKRDGALGLAFAPNAEVWDETNSKPVPLNTARVRHPSRKYAILFAATLPSARRLIGAIQSGRPDFAKEYFVDRAIEEAAFVLERINKNRPPQFDSLRWLYFCRHGQSHAVSN